MEKRLAQFGSRDYLSQFCNNGLMAEAFDVVNRMEKKGMVINRDVIHCLLQGCAKSKDIEAAGHLYDLMVTRGFHTLDFLAGHLIRVFALCGSLSQTLLVFDGIRKPSIHSWNAIISACSTLGDDQKSLELFKYMQQQGVQASSITLQGSLKACINLGHIIEGQVLHGYIIENSLDSDVALMNTVIDMYSKCGSIEEAHNIFSKMPVLTIQSWGCMIAGYARHGDGRQALQLYKRMEFKANNVIFSSVLKGCAQIKGLHDGMLIHQQIVESGSQSDIVVGNTLIHMYAKCGCREEAYNVFKRLPHHTERSWGALTGSESAEGLPLDCLKEMQDDEVIPNRPIFLNLLKSCCNTGNMKQGMFIHHHLVTVNLECDILVHGCLIEMYSKSGSLQDAHKTFEMMSNQTVACWGALISGYIIHGHEWDALELIEEMHQKNIEPDFVIYLCILKACGNIGAAHEGRLAHNTVIEAGLSTDTLVGSALVGFYIKSGFIDEARKVFDSILNRDVLLWAVIIGGYVQHGFCLAAIELYEKMLRDGMSPNELIFVNILKACGSMNAGREGKLVHCQILESKLDSDLLVGDSVLEMYVQSGLMDDAFDVFEKLPFQDILSWSMMIEGCALHGNYLQVHQLLEELQVQGLKPDEYVLTHMLTACVQAGHLGEGIQYFRCLRDHHGVMPSPDHYGCIVDLLGRSGCLQDAKDLLLSIPFQCPFPVWTSLLTSCKAHGNPGIGMQCFDNMMQLEPFDPSGHMLLSNLLVETGYRDDYDAADVKIAAV